jgi:hypothetical protein
MVSVLRKIDQVMQEIQRIKEDDQELKLLPEVDFLMVNDYLTGF